MKEKKIISFYDEYAVRGKSLQKCDKEYMLEYIGRKIGRSNKFYVKKVESDILTTYIIKLDNEELNIRFLNKYFIENQRYMSLFEFFYEKCRKSTILKLKIASIILGLSLGAAALNAEHIEDYFEGVIESCSDFIDDQKFYLGNLKEVIAITELDSEIRSHTGYGDVDGYSQSVNDHYNSHCALGKPTSIDSLYDSIEEYCEEKQLGEEVAEQAILKLELYSDDLVSEASDINLIETYRSEKVKTYK